MWIEDPDGVRIVLVEVPEGQPLRRGPTMTAGQQHHGLELVSEVPRRQMQGARGWQADACAAA